MSRIIPFPARGADSPGMLAKDSPRLDPKLLNFQPIPLHAAVVHIPGIVGEHTAIMRVWAVDEIGRCSLCPKCFSHDGRTCLITVNKRVSAVEAYTFDASDCAFRPEPEKPRIARKGTTDTR